MFGTAWGHHAGRPAAAAIAVVGARPVPVAATRPMR